MLNAERDHPIYRTNSRATRQNNLQGRQEHQKQVYGAGIRNAEWRVHSFVGLWQVAFASSFSIFATQVDDQKNAWQYPQKIF